MNRMQCDLCNSPAWWEINYSLRNDDTGPGRTYFEGPAQRGINAGITSKNVAFCDAHKATFFENYQWPKLVGAWVRTADQYVCWNKDAPGFQKAWLWQYGPGPFKVINRWPVNVEGGVLGFDLNNQEVQARFDRGEWIYFAVPEAAYQYRVEYGVEAVMFHSKYLFLYEPLNLQMPVVRDDLCRSGATYIQDAVGGFEYNVNGVVETKEWWRPIGRTLEEVLFELDWLWRQKQGLLRKVRDLEEDNKLLSTENKQMREFIDEH